MSPEVAAALVRYIVANDTEDEMKDQGHGWLWRKFTGLNSAALNKKRLVFSHDQLGVVPESNGWPETFVFFWLLSSRDDANNSVVVERVKGAVLATLKTAAGVAAGQGVFGTSVMQLHEAHSFASDVTSNVPGASGFGPKMMESRARAAIQKIENAMDDVVYSQVKNTRNEWCIAIKSMMICGAAAVSGEPKNTNIYLRRFSDRTHMETMMAASYRKGMNTIEGRRYTRDLCTQYAWNYDAAAGKLEKIKAA